MSVISYLVNRYRNIKNDVNKLLFTNLQYNQQVTMIKMAVDSELQTLRDSTLAFGNYKFEEFEKFKHDISPRVALIESTPISSADKEKIRETKEQLQNITTEINCFQSRMQLETVHFENIKNETIVKIQEMEKMVEEFSQKIRDNCAVAEELSTLATQIYEMAVAMDSNAENLLQQQNDQ